MKLTSFETFSPGRKATNSRMSPRCTSAGWPSRRATEVCRRRDDVALLRVARDEDAPVGVGGHPFRRLRQGRTGRADPQDECNRIPRVNAINTYLLPVHPLVSAALRPCAKHRHGQACVCLERGRYSSVTGGGFSSPLRDFHRAVTRWPAESERRTEVPDARFAAAGSDQRLRADPRVAGGDRDAFVRLFERYAGRIKAFMMRAGASRRRRRRDRPGRDGGGLAPGRDLRPGRAPPPRPGFSPSPATGASTSCAARPPRARPARPAVPARGRAATASRR